MDAHRPVASSRDPRQSRGHRLAQGLHVSLPQWCVWLGIPNLRCFGLTLDARTVWADNADAVSKAYSGTGALKTDFTRFGVRSNRGALQDGVNSAVRYLKNNFFDGPRQDAYDLVTGSWRPVQGGGTDQLPSATLPPLLLVVSGRPLLHMEAVH